MDLFWYIFLALALWPSIAQRLLEYQRVRLIRQLEQQRGSRVIVMIHRQEVMSFFGFPIYRFINIEDSEQILRAIKMTDPGMPIDLIVHTPGGILLAASQIARALKRHSGKVTVFVPHYAMSGGTLIALAADEIVMDENAVLGPVDPQLGQYPAASIVRAARLKSPSALSDQFCVLLDLAEKAIRQVEHMVYELVADKLPEDRARALARMLAEGHWTHDRPITPEELREWGLRVTYAVPKEVYALMQLYPQPVRRVPTVEYIPEPYPAAPRQNHTPR